LFFFGSVRSHEGATVRKTRIISESGMPVEDAFDVRLRDPGLENTPDVQCAGERFVRPDEIEQVIKANIDKTVWVV
jgi:hypothetical protein